MPPRHPVALLLLAIAATACGLTRTAAWNPDAHAPPSRSRPWHPPEPLAPPDVAPAAPSTFEPARVHRLPDLVDLALETNPETRQAWASARAAAARLGRAEAAYAPTVGLTVPGGWYQKIWPTATGTEIVRPWALDPRLVLGWVLLDFGRRGADRERAQQQLFAANLAFNRRLQQVVFGVQRSFFALDAARSRVHAAEASLAAATTLREAAEARRAVGLATEPEVLLTRQEEALAAYELEAARGAVDDAYAALTEQVGLSPSVPLRVADLSSEPLPAPLPAAVEVVMDAALANRPDLAARLAEVRAQEAAVARARARYYPTLRLNGGVGGALHWYRAGPPFHSYQDTEPEYGALLSLEWDLFDGGDRLNALREAEAGRTAAEARLASEELRVLREVWSAYADARTALRKQEFAEALLAAARDSWKAAIASYREGIGSTLVEVVDAERNLARALTTNVETRAEVLTTAAALAFASGAATAAR